ncbi:hypothetical protein BDQ17DRAFT_1431989 [Cyathus striatus]|nr:hypothetical protein BDQ17DRAFT_1431989 [Cyathus striatus]
MVVESQSLLGIAQIVLLASLIRTGSLSNEGYITYDIYAGLFPLDEDYGIYKYGTAFYQITGQIQVLSPMILIYRVMQGKMCNSQMVAQITQLKFNSDDVPGPSSAA